MDAREMRKALASDWYRMLAERGSSGGASAAMDSISGSTPPSVFVGSYGYPKVMVGPMVPPVHGDTSICDSPERWGGLKLGDIVGMRLGMVRGVKQVRVDAGDPDRYVCSLQEVAMSSRPLESDIAFDGGVAGLRFHAPAAPTADADGAGGRAGQDDEDASDGSPAYGSAPSDIRTPYGPVGVVRSARFSNVGAPSRQIQNTYYDKDMMASDAIFSLYDSGVAMSDIQRCLSMGMLGRKRRLVPTKWGITAADSVISSRLLADVACNDIIDSHRIFWYAHLGNIFAVVLFPHRWVFELIEAWWHMPEDGRDETKGAAVARRMVGFGSDWETARKRRSPINTAGAYYAAQLAVLEYLVANGLQAGALVLREITPEYAVPVGVWQVRQGVRAAMGREFTVAHGLRDAVARAASATSVGAAEWMAHGRMLRLVEQQLLSDYA